MTIVEEIEDTFVALASALVWSACADLTGLRLGVVRRYGPAWALAHRKPLRSKAERVAAIRAREWLLGAPALVDADAACEALGLRRESLVEVLLRSDRTATVAASGPRPYAMGIDRENVYV